MIDFLNHIVCCFGVPMFRVIHLIMILALGWTFPSAVKGMIEILKEEK